MKYSVNASKSEIDVRVESLELAEKIAKAIAEMNPFTTVWVEEVKEITLPKCYYYYDKEEMERKQFTE